MLDTANAALSDDKRVMRMVAAMAELMGVTASPARLKGYAEALADVPIELVRVGINRVSQGWRYPDMPKPADIRAAVDASQRERENDMRALQAGQVATYVCTRCEDSGWVFVAERTDRAQPTVSRCPCYQTNPKLVAPKHYAEAGR